MSINYTVEATTVPVLNNDWSVHYDLLDHCPGAILLEDPIEPALIFAVLANDEQGALTFVEEMTQSFGLPCTKTTITPAEQMDSEYDYGEDVRRP